MSIQHGDQPVDLTQEKVYDTQGRRITKDYVDAALVEVECEEVALDETRAEFPRRGADSGESDRHC